MQPPSRKFGRTGASNRSRDMRRTARMLFLILAGAVALAAAPPSFGGTVGVTITKNGFAPGDVSIVVGDSVTWTNTDQSAHQIVANGGAFTSPLLATGQSWSFTFANAGKFNYQDANAKKLRGIVQVASPAAATVSLAAARQVVVHGTSVALSGQVSTKAAGETVAIFAKAYGQSAFAQIGTVTTGSGGAWSATVKPLIGTEYEAHWKAVASAKVAVSVRPRVTLTIRYGVFTTRVYPARPGKTVVFQRWSTSLRQWIAVKKVTLGSTSSARFRWKPKPGDYKVRIFMPQRQAGAGYLAGFSLARIFVKG